MSIYDNRRENLRSLMRSTYEGKQSLIAAALDRPGLAPLAEQSNVSPPPNRTGITGIRLSAAWLQADGVMQSSPMNQALKITPS